MPTGTPTKPPATATASATSSSGPAASTGKALPTISPNVPKSPAEIQRIKPEELKALLDNKQKLFVVDTQTAQRFAVAHLPDALSMPWENQLKSSMSLPKDQVIVFTCLSDGDQNSSDAAFQFVSRFGYTQVLVLEGGIQKWKDLGYPLETGFYD